MCGIAGIVGPRPVRDWKKWAALTAYRGPDSLDLREEADILLCHNRLSIIDLSAAANQPMSSEDSRFTIVFNGEIFNFLDIRKELAALGHSFRTRSDTEVLIAAYAQWGEGMLDRLDGMFAFAIWDAANKALFAARDHVGIKPFFFSHRDGSFLFASEIKLLLADGIGCGEVREDAIWEYLAYGYIPAPSTAYLGIECLEPGASITFELHDNRLKRKKWWRLPTPAQPADLTLEEAAAEVRRLIARSVRRRLISDVPLGAFLSGGIDSSIIVAEMAEVSGAATKTFSIGWRNNPEYDESDYAAEVATHLGVGHVIVHPEVDAAQLDLYVDAIVRQFDQPYANPTVVLTRQLTALAHAQVTVALIGDGGDELFGGYPRYWALGQQRRLGPIVRAMRPVAASLMALLPETPGANHFMRRSRRFIESSSTNLGETFEQATRCFTSGAARGLARSSRHAGMPRLTFLRDLYDRQSGSWLARACATDELSFLPYNLLEGADRMSMVNSFELRLPFLDRSLMEFAAHLPDRLRIDGGIHKRVLKYAYRDVLPENILMRPKRGFNPPVWHWLQQNLPFVRTLCDSVSPLMDYLEREELVGMIDRFAKCREDNSTQLWSLLVLDRWLRRTRSIGSS